MVPWKLILFLLLMAIFVVFAGFNIKNVADISLGFTVIRDVPIFLSIFIAFLAGAFFMLPFAFRKRKNKPGKETKHAPDEGASQRRNPLYGENGIIEEREKSDIQKDEVD